LEDLNCAKATLPLRVWTLSALIWCDLRHSKLIEAGSGPLPIERYEAYAAALQIPTREFALKMLSYNKPTIYRLLQIDDIASDGRGVVSAEELERRLAPLEQVLLRRNG
jgi:hypothetical protein